MIVLDCGEQRRYRHTAVPGAGEDVPCVRHGYCRVAQQLRDSPTTRLRSRRPRRTECELAALVAVHRQMSLHRLRVDGFTLRLVAAAAADGILCVDLDAGLVFAV